MLILASDHAGFALRKEIAAFLKEENIDFCEAGCVNGEKFDYPLAAAEACDAVLSGKAEKAVLVCGTGIGISIAANKFKGIRAAVCTDEFTAKYTRLHNDANVLCLGGRVVGPGLAREIVSVFLNTEFEGGRHTARLSLISDIENKNL